MGLKSVRFETDGRVATVTLYRPASGNAVDYVMAAELSEACVRVNESNDIRVVVLTGSGDSFCVGTEYPDLTNENQAPAEAALGSLRAARYIAAVDRPVVAALNGDAIDQGLELALGCDLRVASNSARLGLTQVKDGLIPWDGRYPAPAPAHRHGQSHGDGDQLSCGRCRRSPPDGSGESRHAAG